MSPLDLPPVSDTSAVRVWEPLPLEKMDPQIKSIQPGGGIIIHLEQRWGSLRRLYLRWFRRGYVQEMERLRKGDFNPCPHSVLDPRDLKFHRNQGGYYWEPKHDPFAWRDRLPFARAGLAELIVFSLLTYGGAVVIAWQTLARGVTGTWAWVLGIDAAALLVLGLLITWFFRNPQRRIPDEPGTVVSPADGKVVEIEEIEHDAFIGGPAVQIGIFLSIFNVHINRTATAARVIGLTYEPGKHLNALRAVSARENEKLIVRLQGTEWPYRPMVLRQITGALARRIVCRLKPGDELCIGEQFGMIKLGSRTELVLPREPDLEIATRIGETVHAGSSVLARYTAVRP